MLSSTSSTLVRFRLRLFVVLQSVVALMASSCDDRHFIVSVVLFLPPTLHVHNGCTLRGHLHDMIRLRIACCGSKNDGNNPDNKWKKYGLEID